MKVEHAHGVLVSTVLAAEDIGVGKRSYITVLPAGMTEAVDGRIFVNSTPELILKAFNDKGLDLPVDVNHASEIAAPDGRPSPAMGWIKEMKIEDGAIVAGVEWTEDGADLLKRKSYRYASPSMRRELETMRVVEITSVALVNQPAIAELPAVASQQPQQGDVRMDKELLELLGLAESAQLSEVLEAVKTLQTAKQEGVSQLDQAAKELETARAKSADLEKQLASAQDPQVAVPKAMYDAALERAHAAEQKVNQGEKDAHAKASEAVLAKALEEGKILPSTKEYFARRCETPEGLKEFEEFCKAAPALAADQKFDKTKLEPKTVVAEPSMRDTIFRNCGIDPEKAEVQK